MDILSYNGYFLDSFNNNNIEHNMFNMDLLYLKYCSNDVDLSFFYNYDNDILKKTLKIYKVSKISRSSSPKTKNSKYFSG